MPYIFFFAPNGYYKEYLSPLIPVNNALFDSKNGDITPKQGVIIAIMSII
jgi:hypothetical protein